MDAFQDMMEFFNVLMSYNGRRLMAQDCACPLIDVLQNYFFIAQRVRSDSGLLHIVQSCYFLYHLGPMLTMGHESG